MNTNIETFMRELAVAPRAVLALDYDGTLAPFQLLPRHAYPYPRVRVLLQQIVDAGRTRVVLISGRPADEVQQLLGLRPKPEIWGAHGWERMQPGKRPVKEDAGAEVLETLARARTALEAHGLLERAEWKAGSVAVHWRGLADAQAIADGARAALEPLVSQHEFEIMPIAEGLELRCRRRNKGTALATVLAAESATVPVAYIGDDRTDEDAFRVLLGRGLTVRIAGSPDPTMAVVEIPPVDGVIRFLGRWLAATSVQRGKSNSAGSTG